jgi:hypothetical protein
MTTSALNKFLSIFSLVSIATTILTNPSFAESITYRGDKGTYTIDREAGTYRGCLYSGGCISLGRKHLVKDFHPDYKGIGWKKGEYLYQFEEGEIFVSRYRRLLFTDIAK